MRVKLKFPDEKPCIIYPFSVRITDLNYGNHVGNDTMLRYAHEMPASFKDFFMHGLKTGYNLPSNWHISIHLLNLLSLLDCIVRSSVKNEPNRCQDIRALIARIITQLESYHD